MKILEIHQHQQHHLVYVRMFVCVCVCGLETKKRNKNLLQNMLGILFNSWINKQFYKQLQLQTATVALYNNRNVLTVVE